MERFAFKIDHALRQNLYNLCRLCGIDNPDKQPIIDGTQPCGIDDEPDLCRKVLECVGIQVTVRDQMPQRICTLCADKINDIYEYREMCSATNKQTRELLGLPEVVPKMPKSVKKRKKCDIKNEGESILGILGDDADDKKSILPLDPQVKVKKTPKTTKKTTAKRSTSEKRKALYYEDTKFDIKLDLDEEEILPVSKRSRNFAKSTSVPPMVSIAMSSTSHSQLGLLKGPLIKNKEFSIPLLTLKPPNQRERNREMEVKKQENRKRKVTNSTEPLQIPLKQLKVELVPIATIPCPVCPKRLLTQVELRKHLDDNHLPIVYRFGCGGCAEGFLTLDEQKDHHLWHRLSETTYTCRVCDEVFSKLQIFTRHTSMCKLNTDDRPTLPDVVCVKCNQTFATKNLHDWHGCYIVNNGKCVRCRRQFVKKTTLFKHSVKCDGKADTTFVSDSTKTLIGDPNTEIVIEPEWSLVKTEPESVLYADQTHEFGHESHFADQNSDSDSSTAEETTKANDHRNIKNEPNSVDSNDSDDVFVIEDDEPVSIVVDDSSPVKRKEKKSKKHKKSSRRQDETEYAKHIKQEPLDPSEASTPPIRIKIESLDYVTDSEHITKKRDKKISKNKHKNNKKRDNSNQPVICNVKQEPHCEYEPNASSGLSPNIAIKSEPFEDDYQPVFDAEIARRIKSEKGVLNPSEVAQPSLRLKITKKHGTHNAKMLPQEIPILKPSPGCESLAVPEISYSKPPKNIDRKAALLMARIRQEMLERQARKSVDAEGMTDASDGTRMGENSVKYDAPAVRVKVERTSPDRLTSDENEESFFSTDTMSNSVPSHNEEGKDDAAPVDDAKNQTGLDIVRENSNEHSKAGLNQEITISDTNIDLKNLSSKKCPVGLANDSEYCHENVVSITNSLPERRKENTLSEYIQRKQDHLTSDHVAVPVERFPVSGEKVPGPTDQVPSDQDLSPPLLTQNPIESIQITLEPLQPIQITSEIQSESNQIPVKSEVVLSKENEQIPTEPESLSVGPETDQEIIQETCISSDFDDPHLMATSDALNQSLSIPITISSLPDEDQRNIELAQSTLISKVSFSRVSQKLESSSIIRNEDNNGFDLDQHKQTDTELAVADVSVVERETNGRAENLSSTCFSKLLPDKNPNEKPFVNVLTQIPSGVIGNMLIPLESETSSISQIEDISNPNVSPSEQCMDEKQNEQNDENNTFGPRSIISNPDNTSIISKHSSGSFGPGNQFQPNGIDRSSNNSTTIRSDNGYSTPVDSASVNIPLEISALTTLSFFDEAKSEKKPIALECEPEGSSSTNNPT